MPRSISKLTQNNPLTQADGRSALQFKVKVQIDWQFKTEDARIQLKRLYPVLIVK